MGVRTWIEGWPAYQQATGPTGTARPALVREYQQRAGITERTGTEP